MIWGNCEREYPKLNRLDRLSSVKNKCDVCPKMATHRVVIDRGSHTFESDIFRLCDQHTTLAEGHEINSLYRKYKKEQRRLEEEFDNKELTC